MFGFFLLPQLPQNYPQVMKTDGAMFNRLFHGLLDRGVYIAPALYEAGFVSSAHSEADIAETIAAAARGVPRAVIPGLTRDGRLVIPDLIRDPLRAAVDAGSSPA